MLATHSLSPSFVPILPTINEHLSNLYERGEIVEAATIRNFRTVQREGQREVARKVAFYNLDAIIAVGFRVNFTRATQFRQWATGVLRDFAVRGYVLDKERLNVPVHLRRTLRGQAVKCNRVFCSDSVSPVIWTPMQVGDGDDAEDAGLDLEDDAVGEPVDKTSPCVL